MNQLQLSYWYFIIVVPIVIVIVIVIRRPFLFSRWLTFTWNLHNSHRNCNCDPFPFSLWLTFSFVAVMRSRKTVVTWKEDNHARRFRLRDCKTLIDQFNHAATYKSTLDFALKKKEVNHLLCSPASQSVLWNTNPPKNWN